MTIHKVYVIDCKWYLLLWLNEMHNIAPNHTHSMKHISSIFRQIICQIYFTFIHQRGNNLDLITYYIIDKKFPITKPFKISAALPVAERNLSWRFQTCKHWMSIKERHMKRKYSENDIKQNNGFGQNHHPSLRRNW